MTLPRKQLISLSDTPYYHIIERCVLRAFLCGFDSDSNTDYEHRRQWLIDRLALLSEAFAIMSNHYHLVLHVDKKHALGWSHAEIAERWSRIFSVSNHVKQYLSKIGWMSTHKVLT